MKYDAIEESQSSCLLDEVAANSDWGNMMRTLLQVQRAAGSQTCAVARHRRDCLTGHVAVLGRSGEVGAQAHGKAVDAVDDSGN